MRRYRVAAAALVAGLTGAITLGGTASATTVKVPVATPATRIALNPTSQTTLTAPATATLTATIVDWLNKPLPKVAVGLRVLSGPNAGKTTSAVTDAAGNAALSYTSGKVPGTDVVQATFSDGLEVHKSNRPFINWQTGPPATAVRSPASLRVTPTCFQPASAVAEASDVPKTPSPKPRSAGAFPAQSTTITVSGTDFNPFSAVLITFDAGPGGHPQNFEAGTDPFGTFSRQIQVTEPGEGVHLVRADDFREREAQATYQLPCSQGTVALDPPIGPPGFVTMAVGRGFPPNSPITLLNWAAPDLLSPHLKAAMVTGADGTFQFPILILYHDALGFRTLRAIVQDANPDEGNALVEADAPFFVTLGRAQPDDLVLRR